MARKILIGNIRGPKGDKGDPGEQGAVDNLLRGDIYKRINYASDFREENGELVFEESVTNSKLDLAQENNEFVKKAIAGLINQDNKVKETIRSEQNVHFATGTELQLDTKKGGARFVGAKGGQHKSANLFDGNLLGGYMESATEITSPTSTVYKTIKAYVPSGTYTVSFTKNVNLIRSVIDGVFQSIAVADTKKYTFTTNTNGYVYLSFRDSVSSSTNWDNSPIMLNEGTEPLQYEPYGLHVAGDMGFFDGELRQGFRINATDYNNQSRVCTVNAIPCKKGDVIAVTLDNNYDYVYADFYGDNGSSLGFEQITNGTLTVSKDAKSFVLSFGYSSSSSTGFHTFTPSQAGKVTVTIDGQYALCVKERGKNLVSINNITTSTSYQAISCELKKGMQYTVSLSESIDTTMRISKNDGAYQYIAIKGTNATFTADDDSHAIGFYGSGIVLTNLQIEEGEATEYAPYEGKNAFIPLSQPLCAGNTIEKIGDKWYEVQKYGYVDLGKQTWGKTGAGNFVTSLTNLKETSYSIQCSICEKYVYDKTNGSINGTYWDDKNFYVRDTSYTDASDFKTAMNGVKVVYELATPQYAEITDQATLYQLESFEEQTNITTADGLATLTVGYGKSDTVATALGADNKAEIEKYERIEADYGEDVTSHFVLNSNFTSTNFKAWRIGKVVFLKGILTCVGSVTNGSTIFTHDLQPVLTEFTGKMVEESSSYKQISIQFRNTTIAVSSHNLPTANNRYDISCFYIIK